MHSERSGTGKPLLLVHGLGSSIRTWDLVTPALAAQREVIAVDLPGFGKTPPLVGEVTIARLTDALEAFIADENLREIDVVGSSMGGRLVMEMARRGHAGTVIALDPGGFWSDRQAKVFDLTVGNSMKMVRAADPLLPLLANNPIGRSVLLTQFSARAWTLPEKFVLAELRGFKASPSLDEALDSLAHGPKQEGAAAGTLNGKVVIGWGRQDKVAVPSEAARATELFPDATLHWFENCGHFPHWDQPIETVQLILESTE
jgi:pimeloyl-ACP methyl ester carboxylesterase